MKINADIFSSSKHYYINKNKDNSYPNIIQQVDKVINRYKNQLEQLKPKKVSNEENINDQYHPYTERKNNNYSDILKNDSNQYINNIPTTPNIYNALENNKKLIKTENNFIYEEIKKENNNYNNYDEPNNDNNKNEYNFKYKTNKLNEYSNINKHFNENNNSPYDIKYEMENDNIKLESALTSEKTKVLQLLNLLRIKENEIKNLKQKIEQFEVKINDIENKYQNMIYSIKQEQSIQLNDIYNNLSDEKNKIVIDFNQIKRNNEIQLEQIKNELYNDKKIIKLFFDLFNKNIDLFDKTEILRGINNIMDNNYTEENAFLAVETLDNLINKLFQDNKDLYNELMALKGEINNSNLILAHNSNFIEQENTSLRKLVHNLTSENIFLKNKNSYNKNNKTFSNQNNYHLTPNQYTRINNRDMNNNHNNISHSFCRYHTPDSFRINKSSSFIEIPSIKKIDENNINIE